MAKKDPAENERVSVKLKQDTLIEGSWYEKGSNVEVFPFQKRHLVEGHYVEGDIPEDIVSPGEKDAQALDVLKPASERKGMIPSVAFADYVAENGGYGIDPSPGPEGNAFEQSGQPPKKSSE